MSYMGQLNDIEIALSKWIGERFDQDAKLENLTRLSGGASQETWKFDITSIGDTAPYILRRRPFKKFEENESQTVALATEAKLLKLSGQRGVPVPNVIDVFAPDSEIGEAFIMTCISGETIPRKILRDDEYAAARQALPEQCGAALAKIHSINVSEAPELNVSSGEDQLNQYEQIYRDLGNERPVIELAIKWLRNGLPETEAPVLVHGDFRLGNIIVNIHGLASVIDWELAHIGDAREDIGWMCVNSWRFGNRHNRLGGFGSLEPFLASYAATGGQSFSPGEINWWQALGSFKWGIMCMIMYDAFQSGADPSVERAMIGRRVSETELDLLNIIEGKD